jgi:two-component system cell cycle response regulator DivK
VDPTVPDGAPERATILIVDDTPDGREIYSLHLQHRGFTVLTARDGNEGVEMARQHQPDVIIMDIAMARLDGIAATKRLKRDARTRRTPVIVLTAYPGKPVQQQALEAGASVFLTKPCLPDELEAHIRRLLAAQPPR